MAKKTKLEMLEALRGLLREVLKLRTDGAAYAKLSRASGAVDGYVRALLELGVAEEREILALIAAERGAVDGPATTELKREDSAAVLAA